MSSYNGTRAGGHTPVTFDSIFDSNSTVSDSASTISLPDRYDEVSGFETLTKEILLNSTSNMMGISRFELRLLHFFDVYCIPLFSFGVNLQADRMWRNQVPRLFSMSPLVRKSIFSFASINMWPLHDVQTLFLADVQEAANRYSIAGCYDKFMEDASMAEDYFALTLATVPTDNLYRRTVTYFAELLADTQNLVQHEHTLQDPFRAVELRIAGVLIFSFLGLHPHRLVPVLNFQLEDEDGNIDTNTTDFVAICRGVQTTFELSADLLRNTSFKAIHDDTNNITPTIKDCRFALITRIEKDTTEYFAVYEDIVDPQISAEKEAIKESIELLATAFYHCVRLNYPVPLFKWALFVPDHFDVLLRNKHLLALRLYYQYACLCCITRFSLYHDRNMWKDFIKWFRDHNLRLHGGWYYVHDRYFYQLVVEKNYKIPFGDLSFLYDFDPEAMCMDSNL